MAEVEEIAPQEGPQTEFLTTEADIAIYGGAAGGGKSYGLILEGARWVEDPDFGGVIFRRTTPEITNEGGLWDESEKVYAAFGAKPNGSKLRWTFPSGAEIRFSHLEHEKTKYKWQGSQIPFIGFDELTHFTETQFFYMLSRNRSTSGIPPCIRCTTNPDARSWVKKFIQWWLDEKTGYPIKNRSGKLRWFIRIEDKIVWGNSKTELKRTYGANVNPLSVTFIAAKLSDNKILEQKDPSYRQKLEAMTKVDRERLLFGNWNIMPTAGNVFRREWFPMVEAIPGRWTAVCRYWDRAGTVPNVQNPNPDWTRGLKMYAYPDGTYLIADIRSARDNPGQIEKFIKNVAPYDGHGVRIRSQQDPGSAGKGEGQRFVRMLPGYDVKTEILTKNKFARAKSFSAQCEAQNVRVLKGTWNDEMFDEFENFSDNPSDYDHDDIVDVASGAFNDLTEGYTAFGNLDRLERVLRG